MRKERRGGGGNSSREKNFKNSLSDGLERHGWLWPARWLRWGGKVVLRCCSDVGEPAYKNEARVGRFEQQGDEGMGRDIGARLRKDIVVSIKESKASPSCTLMSLWRKRTKDKRMLGMTPNQYSAHEPRNSLSSPKIPPNTSAIERLLLSRDRV